MASLAEIRARLAQQARRGQAAQGDDTLYRHWDIEEGTTAVVRFFPDLNEQNDFFWLERQMMRFDFAGVKGGDETRRVQVQVPCVEMWGETCPVHQEIRPWFKDPNLETLGRRYWKKRSYIMQGIVVTDPMNSTASQGLKRFMISPQIFTVIKQGLMDPEISSMPSNSQDGLDFRITKTSKGGYSDYSTSSWSRRERALTPEELVLFDQRRDLTEGLPKRPDAEHMRAIVEMFHASVNGELYDPERWGQFYRPWGLDDAVAESDTNTPAAPAVAKSDPVAATAVPASDVDEILAKARRAVAQKQA